ncbi:MAG: glycoside hydrolase family 2 TIM barrel-domain containing protein [Chthoniobacteraceae bacterium]
MPRRSVELVARSGYGVTQFVTRIFSLAALFLAGSMASGLAATRQDVTLADGWKFIREDAGLDAGTNGWQNVTIPHTWNTIGADAGKHHSDAHFKSGYYRGACWYARVLDIPADWRGKRVFIRFEAAALVAKTYLNGQLLGEHRGGFTAFCYELTPLLHFGAANELRVQVDNSHQEDVPPLSGDFNVDGGIYRPVHLIVTDPVCISPLNMASPGVYLTTKLLTDAVAEIEVKTLVSNGAAGRANPEVKAEIADAGGKIVTWGMEPATVESGSTAEVTSTLRLNSPHRWNGRKDPYLYTAIVSLARGDETRDSIKQPLGLRTVAISEEKGFLLNGQPYPIYGVNRHQDWGDGGWAATDADYDEDAKLILDMGATAVRLTHYPQSDYWHDLCDRNGLLLWNEVSLVNEIRDTPEFSANAEQQLRELILQRYNHPCVAFWGLFNEVGLAKTSPPDALLKRLKAVIGELDQSRLIVAAIFAGNKSYNQIPDHPCFNRYPGWYQKNGTMESSIEAGAKEVGKRIALSEYGAGANTAQHEEGALTQPNPNGPFHPEEWQTYVHETDWAGMKDNPLVWGTFAWVMFDFQSASRHEGGQPHLNDKGLVTEDRKTKKDAYYFYQANWSDEPMIHIASSRMTPRRLAVTDIEVFSNCDRVELIVNGKSLGAAPPDNVKVFRWGNVTLQPGRNEIKAIASSGGRELDDSCEWVLEPGKESSAPGAGL